MDVTAAGSLAADERLLTAKDIQYIFSISKNHAYDLMNSAGFPALKIGSRLYVTRRALDDWINSYTGRAYAL